MPCAICPSGCGTVWIGTDTEPIVWKRLVHVDTWRLVPNRQEANKKRTSDTGGAAVKFCGDVVDFTFEVTNTLCIDDWLYADILSDPTNPALGKTAWFFFGWDCDHAPAPQGTGTDPTGDDPDDNVLADLLDGTYVGSSGGLYAKGVVNPPGFGVDNNGSDPSTADWTVDVIVGPRFPKDTGTAGVGPYSTSDADPDSVESAA